MLERERLIEIAVSVGGVGVMVALLYYIGSTHTSEANGHQVLSPSGGELVVYSIIAFIVLMAIVGVVLIQTVTVPEARADDGDSSGA
ncbi:hypothetical protein L593_07525 [Salinarchaeum sp. Harcht-Bsk1]|uniref:DUF7472 family protein n=1 Tax=Salinarchaeum sp. Harcht-Bsk1 TaxID=1333523 RepID=UPI00034238DC|nr:hypothetical protein [Salinarchaeum sp. Harcht-Bsk1]AGN01450.1 hypothetical protein L593_07525 [Salinarchaeum sp. Harcht-Bsk1]